MRRLTLVFSFASMFFSCQSHGQQELLGKYEAKNPGYSQLGSASQFWTLEITAAENGKLAGKLHVAKFDCRGDYSVEGLYRDGKLDMKTVAGAIRGCGDAALILSVEGNKLVGTHRGIPVEFLKRH